MKLDFSLLKQICEEPGVPGYEDRIRALVLDHLDGLVDEVTIDSMGSVIALKKGKQDAERVMVTAHMDEIGFMVSHIDDKGFIRFQTLGGFDPKTLTSQRVVIHGKRDVIGIMGTKPIHIMKGEEKNKAPKMEDYFIDCGFDRGDEVKEIISVGDTITRERSLIELGDCVNGKSMDNRVSVYILLEALRQLKGQTLPYDTYAVFTVQEEVGLRGAINAAGHINPTFGINLDVTIAYDTPGAAAHEAVTSLGSGAAIKILDGSVICDSRMVAYMKEIAEESNIKWQPEILPAGGTDTAGIQRFGKDGAIAGAISIPLRNMHSVIESANKKDIEGCTDLLTACLKGLGDYSWKFS